MRDGEPAPRAAVASGVPLVAAAAALWGTDALFRRGLALELPAVTVVFWEHLLLVALTLPLLVRIPWRRLDRRSVVALVVIGAGASALATILFTASFRLGDPNTPLLLQKLQPVFAVVLARLILGERPRRTFAAYFVVALGAAWLITFPDPTQLQRPQILAGALAAGAAALWAMGTVLGRYVSDVLRPAELTAARFAFGLPVAFVLLALLAPAGQRGVAGDDLLPLVLLSLGPGLLSLLLYYRGLRRTPASVATVAELAFPVSALAVNHLAFGATISATQLLGLLTLTSVIVVLSVTSRRPAASTRAELVTVVPVGREPATADR